MKKHEKTNMVGENLAALRAQRSLFLHDVGSGDDVETYSSGGGSSSPQVISSDGHDQIQCDTMVFLDVSGCFWWGGP